MKLCSDAQRFIINDNLSWDSIAPAGTQMCSGTFLQFGWWTIPWGTQPAAVSVAAARLSDIHIQALSCWFTYRCANASLEDFSMCPAIQQRKLKCAAHSEATSSQTAGKLHSPCSFNRLCYKNAHMNEGTSLPTSAHQQQHCYRPVNTFKLCLIRMFGYNNIFF